MTIKLFHLLLSFTLLLFTFFWLTSYSYYNTFGIDSEKRRNDNVEYHYYRFWWPGNGALLIGKSIVLHQYDASKRYQIFDLGAAFFRQPSDKMKAYDLWSKAGFYYINLEKPVCQIWIGIPAWFPVFIILGYFYTVRFRRETE
jgi:hypothetical protein